MTRMCLYAVAGMILSAQVAKTQTADLDGAWANVDRAARSLTKLEFSSVSGADSVEAWGKCAPTDCPWGKTQVSIVHDFRFWQPDSLRVVVAVFTSDFSTTTVVMSRGRSHDILHARLTVHYKAVRNRADRSDTVVLKRTGR